MDSRWCVGPYMYPGLQGTPFNPAPSSWPSPKTVAECACEVFNSPEQLRHYLYTRVVSVEDLQSRRTLGKLDDMRAMCTHILIRCCMWLPAPGEVPEPYTYALVGSYFGRSRHSAIRSHHRAMNLLDTSPHFRQLFQQVQECLAKRGYRPHQTRQ